MDLFNPNWTFEGARLDGVDTITASVGQLPFNFQVGDERNKVKFSTPQTPAGELEVHLDNCDGEILVRLPLAPAALSQGVTTLRASIAPRSGTHDLCLRFAQRGIDPLWVLDWVQPTGKERG